MTIPSFISENMDQEDTRYKKRKGKTVSFVIIENENRRMQTFSVLDTKPSHILDYPLTVKQQIWLLFLLPSLWLIIMYIIDVGTDIAVGFELINEGYFLPGALTLLFVYIPPLLSYFIRLSEPPDTKEMKVAFAWLSVETAAFLLFPIRPLQCFSERIFWSIEAMRLGEPYREEAMVEFEQTHDYVIDNYMFMEAIFQAGPQAFLQILLLLFRTSSNSSTELVQLICLISSLISLASVISSYQRYETQVRGGRHQLWSSNDRSLTTLLNISEQNISANDQRYRQVKIMEEDNPLGSVISFLFWYFFLFGRILSITIAFKFFPWAVIGICAIHYVLCLIYIIFTHKKCNSTILYKIMLGFLYIISPIEVGIQFRKSNLFYSLYFSFTLIEDISLTLLWFFWAKYVGVRYNYCMYFIGIMHLLALIFLTIYFKFFKPNTRKIEVH